MTTHDTDQKTILIVDDEPVNLVVLTNLLKTDYRVIAARSGEQAIARARGEIKPDLILLDIMMPGMDGYVVCSELKSHDATRDIPVVFVTAMNDELDETKGLEAGAIDYITKPISPTIVSARVRNHLALKAAQDQLANQNQILEERVAERTRELVQAQDITIMALASLAETRDNETGNHIRRTQHYVRVLAQELRNQDKYVDELTDDNIELLFKSAPLHDIGKVGIPDSILLKPGKLTDDEFRVMKNHPALGNEAIVSAEAELGVKETPFLRYAREISEYHHEKWDGSGYPHGLSGEDIPLSGRLMALADVYDALISKRVYKPAFSHDKAKGIILEGRGTHFDPQVLDAFLAREQDFVEIAEKYKDD